MFLSPVTMFFYLKGNTGARSSLRTVMHHCCVDHKTLSITKIPFGCYSVVTTLVRLTGMNVSSAGRLQYHVARMYRFVVEGKQGSAGTNNGGRDAIDATVFLLLHHKVCIYIHITVIYITVLSVAR